jgi:hypothetical protein
MMITNGLQCSCNECQGDPRGETAILHADMKRFSNLLNEKQKRLFAALEANRLGHGGQKKVAQLLDISAKTMGRGQQELAETDLSATVRRPGGGRKRVEKKADPLETVGDPFSR